MTTNEWEELAGALTESWKRDSVERRSDGQIALTPEPAAELRKRDTGERKTEGPTAGAPESTVESVVRSIVATQSASQERRTENVRPSAAAQSSRTSAGGSGSSIASEVLKTAAMVTGIGPLATGLMKLFGGGSDDKPAAPPLVRYQLPSPVQVDAGLMSNRALTQVSYAQNDQVRAETNTAPVTQAASPSTMPAIQIQVNAMDSRSFLDHSDEIAQAVRSAMLRSHALNDVVSEI